MANFDETDDGSAKRSLDAVQRRDLLKTAAASAVTVAGTSASASAERYAPDLDDGDDVTPHLRKLSDGDTLELPEDGRYVIDDVDVVGVDGFTVIGNGSTLVPQGHTLVKLIGDNWSFGGLAFDQSAGGGDFMIWTGGGGWDLHHCAWLGPLSTADQNPVWVASDPGSENYIRSCWFGDGLNDPGDSAMVSFSGRGSEAGHSSNNDGIVHVEDVYFYQMGVYGLMSADPDGYDGTFHYDSCYWENPYLHGPRIGNPTVTSRIHNCVMVTDDPNEVPTTSSGVRNSRGIWAWFGDVEVTETDILNTDWSAIALNAKEGYTAHVEYKSGNIQGYVENSSDGTVNVHSEVGSDPRTSPPASCPTSPEEALSGSGDGSPDDPAEVAEDFSHDDVPGTYAGDTGAYATSSVRATSDSYSLTPAADSNGSRIILRDDMGTTAGNSYELDVYHQSGSDADMGFLFGAQRGTSWGEYVGYLGFFDANADEIRIDRWENGSQVASSSTGLSWPLDEWLTAELDYRNTDSSTITMTVSDASGTELASVSLADTTYDDGTVGWYNWHAASDWHADSWFGADSGDGQTAVEDFERADPLAEYGGADGRFSVTSSSTYEGSKALVNDSGSYASAVSTSGLDSYPQRGDEVHYYFDNAADDNFVAVHLFAQSEEDAPDTYTVGIGGTGGWRIWKQVDGNFQRIASQDLPASDQIDGWYRAEVRTDSTTIYADLYDDSTDELLASVQADDTTYSSGGIGFRSAGNGEIWDYVVHGN